LTCWFAACSQCLRFHCVRVLSICSHTHQFTEELKGYSLSSNRYMILEGFGCLPAIWPSKLSMVLAFSPQLILAFFILLFSCEPPQSYHQLLFAFLYLDLTAMSIVNLFRFQHYRTAGIGETPPALGRARFVRLLIFCTVMSIFAPVVISLLFYYSLKLSLAPWPGWTVVHRYFSHPLRLSARFLIRLPVLRQLHVFAFWAYAATAFIAFASLISGQEVSNDCKRAWTFVNQRLLRRRRPSPAPASSTPDEPLSGTNTIVDQDAVGYDGDTEKKQDEHIPKVSVTEP
jgi:hypothetical protein